MVRCWYLLLDSCSMFNTSTRVIGSLSYRWISVCWGYLEQDRGPYSRDCVQSLSDVITLVSWFVHSASPWHGVDSTRSSRLLLHPFLSVPTLLLYFVPWAQLSFLARVTSFRISRYLLIPYTFQMLVYFNHWKTSFRYVTYNCIQNSNNTKYRK